jgi:restriction system protein
MDTATPFEDAETLWVVHIGNNNRIALRALDEDFVCIGWTAMGDLSEYDTRDKMRSAMERTFPDWKRAKIRSSYGQPYRFAHEMEVGDPIVYPVKPNSEIAIGRIDGPYRWAEDDQDLAENDYCNVRPVEWLKKVPRTVFSQAALHSFGSFMSVSTSDDYLEEVQEVLVRDVDQLLEEESTDTREDGLQEDSSAPDLYDTATQETEDYLLKEWQSTGHQFERVVAAVFESIGYTAKVTQKSHDHGIDVVAHPDPLGMESPFIKIEVKSGSSSVNEGTVNQLRGTLNRGEEGVVVSLGGFTSDAEAVARGSNNLTLIGPKRFVEIFLDHYDALDPTWRARYPLDRVYVPSPR